MLGDHDLCGLPEEGAHEKSPKCLGGNLGDFWGNFAKVSGRLKTFQTAFLFLNIVSDCRIKRNWN